VISWSQISIELNIIFSLEAYYVYIHPFFPILPPPIEIPVDRAVYHLQGDIPEFESSSPLGLAISAVLALIPCPNDLNYQVEESIIFRRKYAQFLSQSSIEGIDNETELFDSVTPSDALAIPMDELTTQRFHPEVPQPLEDVIALDILSFYEYAQRGNLKKMRNRANQALASAVNLSLHECSISDEHLEVKARVWWMTVSLVLHNLSSSMPDSSSTYVSHKQPL
jgi:hypothetical protein